jgi:predicted tellurium resistance membrane protein TerC
VNSPPDARRNSAIGGVGVLVIRGVLLWLVVPLATLWWLIARAGGRARGITLGQFLGWTDLNLIACIQRTVGRPVVRFPLDRVPVSDMRQVTHRLRVVDPA